MKSKWDNREALQFTKKFKHQKISKELAHRIYTSRLLGNDSSLVLHGGGNTSLKSEIKNSQGLLEEVIYVKGSGKDMSDIDIDGLVCSNTTVNHNYPYEGGLSGEKLFEISNKNLVSLRHYLGTSFPIIASGGVMSRDHFQKKIDL